MKTTLKEIQIKRFVPKGRKAAQLFNAKYHDSEIRGANQHIYYSKKKIKAPVGWSATAIDIAASKYFRKTIAKENSIFLLVDRVVLGLKSAAKDTSFFKNDSQITEFLEEIKYILLSQRAAFNSPVWFNLGLKEAYNLKSKSQHYCWNKKTKKVVEINDAYSHPQTSACFIQSIEDSLESIFDLVKSEAKLFKYGSGSGTNFSKLRGRNEEISTGGNSSGLLSFLDVLDKAAGAIKSGGTTRRAAKMVCVDLDHPEILEFISWKQKEEEKAKTLIAAGYSADLDGETYKSISGQNANNSVRVPDRFMRMIGKNKKWSLKNRLGRSNFKTVAVDDLWKQICEAAWNCADPGLQFDDTINRYHTCTKAGRINASNPCSEYMFLDDSACNLASVNLVKFLDENLNFQLDDFIHVLSLILIAQECLIDYSSYPTAKIAENAHLYRPLGLGFANLGSFLMRLGLPYDSEEGRAWAGFLTCVMTGVAYETSIKVAQKIGPFAGYKANKKSMQQVITQHAQAVKKINWQLLPSEYQSYALDLWSKNITEGKKHGFRNAQATVIAPTGTIGLVMDCDTTGIEPDFSLIKNKKLSGGGYLKIINQAVESSLRKLGYSDAESKIIISQLSEFGEITKTDLKKEHYNVFACATGDVSLSPSAHLKMMAAVQPFISGAISKTVNLPADATIEEVSATYIEAWKLGLKSIALYRDGSKFVQPLSASSKTIQVKYPACTECGHETVLESGCFKCVNCGTTTACSS